MAERRAEPQDDLLSGFIAAEIDGERLSTEDILDISYLFLLAGLDTVTASLGCAVAYLAAHPDRQQALRDDPSLVPAAVEELLRWETPVPGVPRITTRDVEVAGTTIAGRARPSPACSRRPTPTAREFPDPESIDFNRSGNRHLAFGGGVHRCLGSHLARLEMRVALEEFHRRVPAVRGHRGRDADLRDGHPLARVPAAVVDGRLMRVTRRRRRLHRPRPLLRARARGVRSRRLRPLRDPRARRRGARGARGAGPHRPRQLPRARDHDLRVAARTRVEAPSRASIVRARARDPDGVERGVPPRTIVVITVLPDPVIVAPTGRGRPSVDPLSIEPEARCPSSDPSVPRGDVTAPVSPPPASSTSTCPAWAWVRARRRRSSCCSSATCSIVHRRPHAISVPRRRRSSPAVWIALGLAFAVRARRGRRRRRRG